MKLILYGPPGSGKSVVGEVLAKNLALPFFDLDHEIEKRAGQPIPDIFANLGEPAFRQMEQEVLERLLVQAEDIVLALGGGALLAPANRAAALSGGQVICLQANLDVLSERIRRNGADRPLLPEPLSDHLSSLLATRTEHYASFPIQIDTSQLSLEEIAWQVQVRVGAFRVTGMGPGYPVRVMPSGVEQVGMLLRQHNLGGPVALVCDTNVAGIYAEEASRALQQAGYDHRTIVLPAGEEHKNLAAVERLWGEFLAARLDRRSTVLALGGGVITDLAGFAAATYLRGLNWVAVPTSLLGMVDASLGGKTGIDLAQGKNLAGAFHAPELVAAFPALLASLPPAELRNGLAEVVKHAVLADPELFGHCAAGWDSISALEPAGLNDLISRSMAVKVRILLEDPYEQGRREVLNLGHTVGHAVEHAAGYRIRHGEAVAVGLVWEARIGEAAGITEPGLSQSLAQVLSGLGLPVDLPTGLDRETLRQCARLDKKRRGNRIRLPLPQSIGQVHEGYELAEEELWRLF